MPAESLVSLLATEVAHCLIAYKPVRVRVSTSHYTSHTTTDLNICSSKQTRNEKHAGLLYTTRFLVPGNVFIYGEIQIYLGGTAKFYGERSFSKISPGIKKHITLLISAPNC